MKTITIRTIRYAAAAVFGAALVSVTLSSLSTRAHAMQWGDTQNTGVNPGNQNELANFVPMELGKQPLSNAAAIEYSHLMRSGLKESPWSSDFWPDVKGSIADPYAETGNGIIMLKRTSWPSNRPGLVARKGLHRQAATDPRSIAQEKFDNFSPSEKYDMLVGDRAFTLSEKIIDMVDQRSELNLVAVFSGICHGWAPASLTYPRPLHAVKLLSNLFPGADRSRERWITFYPDDIKALASYVYGKGRFRYPNNAPAKIKFEGTKCYSGGQTDKYARLVDPKCFNINPALFHLVAVNQLGINHQGFMVDRKDDHSVWNHPVYAYDAKYYRVTDRHPQPGMSLSQAKTYLGTHFWDAYAPYRSPKAVAVVGVEMTFWYGVENKNPDHSLRDDPSRDNVDHQTMRYDLELDAHDEIVGGEWREFDSVDAPTLFEAFNCAKPQVPCLEGNCAPCEPYTHPNSIWFVPPTVLGGSSGDVWLNFDSKWDGSAPMPADWTRAAIEHASANTESHPHPKTGQLVKVPEPQVLEQIVSVLIQKSRE